MINGIILFLKPWLCNHVYRSTSQRTMSDFHTGVWTLIVACWLSFTFSSNSAQWRWCGVCPNAINTSRLPIIALKVHRFYRKYVYVMETIIGNQEEIRLMLSKMGKLYKVLSPFDTVCCRPFWLFILVPTYLCSLYFHACVLWLDGISRSRQTLIHLFQNFLF